MTLLLSFQLFQLSWPIFFFISLFNYSFFFITNGNNFMNTYIDISILIILSLLYDLLLF